MTAEDHAQQPPCPSARDRPAIARLVRDGTVSPVNAATARGLVGWAPPDPGGWTGPAAEALHAMRAEECR